MNKTENALCFFFWPFSFSWPRDDFFFRFSFLSFSVTSFKTLHFFFLSHLATAWCKHTRRCSTRRSHQSAEVMQKVNISQISVHKETDYTNTHWWSIYKTKAQSGPSSNVRRLGFERAQQRAKKQTQCIRSSLDPHCRQHPTCHLLDSLQSPKTSLPHTYRRHFNNKMQCAGQNKPIQVEAQKACRKIENSEKTTM